MKTSKKRAQVHFAGCATLALLSVVGCAPADRTDGHATVAALGPIDPQIQAQLDVIGKMVPDATVAPEELAQAMYWPEAMIDGEGSPKTYRSRAEFLPFLSELTKTPRQDCAFAIKDALVSSGTLAAVYAELTCHAGDTVEVEHVLYVWEKRGTQWRIIRESYLMGPFH